jgi:hypothetical protein
MKNLLRTRTLRGFPTNVPFTDVEEILVKVTIEISILLLLLLFKKIVSTTIFMELLCAFAPLFCLVSFHTPHTHRTLTTRIHNTDQNDVHPRGQAPRGTVRHGRARLPAL